MPEEIIVQIIGAPVACAAGTTDPWQGIAAWTGEQLRQRFGAAVRVAYYDLFDPACPAIPTAAQLPLVLLNGAVLSSGGKVSIPLIRRQLEAIGIRPVCAEPALDRPVGASWP